MAANGTAIGDDHATRSRRPNWTICAPSGALPTFAARCSYSAGSSVSSSVRRWWWLPLRRCLG